MNTPAKPLPAKKRSLAAVVGTGAAALLLSYVPQFEGTILKGYKDPIGIVTACTGHTKTAVLGLPYTKAECETLLSDDLLEHADGVQKCITAPMTTYQKAAFISFAFNVGNGAFCKSTMARKFNAGDAAGACAEFPRWTLAGGRVLPGLVKRRVVERQLCEGRLT